MLNFFRRYISPSASQRSKLSVHLIANSKSREATAPDESAAMLGHALLLASRIDLVLTNGSSPTVIRDGYTWRASVPMSAGAIPIKPMAEFMNLSNRLGLEKLD
tara:strand:+ start:2730 stop:3041 length:312 start_codon:yes stop_codon:yes gene_type:complete